MGMDTDARGMTTILLWLFRPQKSVIWVGEQQDYL